MLCISLETMFGRLCRVDRESSLSKPNWHELEYSAAADVRFNDLIIDFVLITTTDMRIQWFALGIVSNEHSDSSIRHTALRWSRPTRGEWIEICWRTKVLRGLEPVGLPVYYICDIIVCKNSNMTFTGRVRWIRKS